MSAPWLPVTEGQTLESHSCALYNTDRTMKHSVRVAPITPRRSFFRSFGYNGAMKRVVPILAAETLLLSSIYLYFCHRAGPFGFPLDDSWIHAHFARNIAEGRGIVYNPGQHVTSTAMLYSMLLSGMYALTKAPVANAVALGLLLHSFGAILVYSTARWLALSEALALVAATVFAAVPRLLWGALSGMEVPLYVFLVCLGVYWHVRYRVNDGIRAYLPTLAFGLAALARPECAALVGCSLGERLISYLRFERNDLHWVRVARSVPVHAAVFCAVIAPVALYNMQSYQKPLPPAFYAKTRSVERSSSDNQPLMICADRAAMYLREAVVSARRDNLVLCVLLIPGMIACVRSTRNCPASGVLVLPLALVLVPLATAFAAPMGSHQGSAQLLSQHGR